MRSVIKLSTLLFCLIGVVSCSSNDIPSEESNTPTVILPSESKTVQNIGTPMSVIEFINLVKDDCTQIELDFLNSLNPQDTLYVYDQSEVNYPKIDETNVDIYKELIKNKLDFSSSKIKPITKTTAQTKGFDDMIESRIATIGIKSGYNPLLEHDVQLLADVSYVYNITDHKIDTSYPCNIVAYASAQGDPSIMLTFVNQGSSAYAIDYMTITYAVLGQIQLSAAFGNFGAGSVIEQVHEAGSLLVQY